MESLERSSSLLFVEQTFYLLRYICILRISSDTVMEFYTKAASLKAVLGEEGQATS